MLEGLSVFIVSNLFYSSIYLFLFLPLFSKIYLFERQKERQRDGNREKDLSPEYSLSKWPQELGLDQDEVRN